MRILLSVIALLCLSLSGWAQALNGQVIDSETGQAIPFATLIPDDQVMRGTTADIDGYFSFPKAANVSELTVSCVGYQKQNFATKGKTSLTVQLVKKGVELSEVVILPGENPAHRIIKRAIRNKDQNNPETARAFRYLAYHKFVFTADLDTFEANPADTTLVDSSMVDLQEFLEEQHIFLMESVTERIHKPPHRDYEEVLGSRVSGFKNPGFATLATQMQSFTLYENEVSLNSLSYLSPLARGSTREYLFLLEDTLYDGQDSIYILSFRPRTGKKFRGLQGMLHIHTNGYALANATASPADEEEAASIKIRQHYELVEGKQWFPVQLDTRLGFKGSSVNGLPLIAVGRSYLDSIALDPPLKNRQFSSTTLNYSPEADARAEEVLKEHRHDTLTYRDRNTYQVIDSIGEEFKFDRRLKWVMALASGELPLGKVSLDLKRILFYNEHEGFRLGAGLLTNDKVSKYFSLGGYVAYGFRDQEEKYGGELKITPWPRSNTLIQFGYYNDKRASAGQNFFQRVDPIFDAQRDLMVSRMARFEKYEARVRFRGLRHFEWQAFGARQHVTPQGDYQFVEPQNDVVNLIRDEFDVLETGLESRFALGEKFMQTPFGQFSLGHRGPLIITRITKGIRYGGEGDFDYWKIDLAASTSVTSRYLGISRFRVDAGYVDNPLPYALLYTPYAIRKNWNLEVLSAFSTMASNEFLADQMVTVGWEHMALRPIFKHEKWKVQPAVFAKAGWGRLQNPEYHRNIDFKTMEDGYYEVGVALHRIYQLSSAGIGLAAAYRMGPYQLDDFEDNFSIKISITPVIDI